MSFRAVRIAPVIAAFLLGTAAPALASDPDAALRAFDEGEKQFKLGNYDAAATRFKEAWDLHQDPVYVFNIGLAYERQERWPLAVRYYRRFLEVDPKSPAKPDVERRLAAAERSRAAAQATIAVRTRPAGALASAATDEPGETCTTPCELRTDAGPVTLTIRLGALGRDLAKSLRPGERWVVEETLEAPAPAEPEPEPDDDRPLTPKEIRAVAAFGVAGVALTSGILFGASATGDFRRGEEIVGAEEFTASDREELDELRRGVKRNALLADLSFAVALAGAALGAIWWSSGDDPPPASATLLPGGAAVEWTLCRF